MIRFLFWMLLLVNIVFFAVMQWGSAFWSESVVTQPPLNADKIRLLDAKEIALEEMAAAHVLPAQTNPANLELALSITPPPVEKLIASICLEWGEFLDVELKQVEDSLEALDLGGKLTKRQVEHMIGFWVYIPPLKDKAAINKKIAQLKERGVSEYFIVQEAGTWMNAISLGVFRTEEAAQHYLNKLRSNKIISAKVGKRNSKHKLSIMMLNDVDAGIEAKLTALQEKFSGSELKQVSCTLTR
jgi:SPOR domain